MTTPRAMDEDEARGEHLTKVILVLMGTVLFSFSLVIFLGWVTGVFDSFPVKVMIALDLSIIVGLWLAHRNHWRASSYIPPGMVYLLALYGTFEIGPTTTLLLFYGLAIVGSALLQGIRAQWSMLVASIAAITISAWIHGDRSMDTLGPIVITSGSALLGVAILQWLSTSQVKSALSQSRSYATELIAYRDHLERANEALREEIDRRKSADSSLRRQVKKLKVLHAVATATVENTLEDSLIKSVTHIICDAFYSDHIGVLLLDEESGVLRPHASYKGIPKDSKELSIPLGYGVIGHVAEHGQSWRIADVIHEPLYIGVNVGMRSELCVPLKVGQYIIGVINAESALVDNFTKEDERLLTTLANQLATAIQKLRFLEESQRRTNELSALYETALTTSGVLKTNTLLQRLYMQVQGLLSPDAFIVATYNAKAQEISIVHVMEEGKTLPDWENLVLPLEESGLTGWVIQNQQPLLVGDLLSDPLPVQPKHGNRPARAWLGVPLIARNRLIGAISVQSFRPNAFDKEHKRFMSSLATQAAIALENARLFEAERERSRELKAVARLSLALRMAQTRDEMVPIILDQSLDLLNAQAAAMFLIDSANNEAYCNQARGDWEGATGVRIPAGQGVIGKVVQSCNPYFNNDVRKDPDFYRPDLLGDTYALVCVPFVIKDQPIGALFVGRQVEIIDADVHTLTALADIAASAILRASLHEETQRRVKRLAALRTIDQAITASVDLRLTLIILLEQVTTHLNVDAATVLLLKQNSQSLEFAARIGFHTGALRHTHLRLGESHAGKAALERQTVHIADLSDSAGDLDRAVLLSREGFVSYFAVPLIAKGKVKGVMEIFHRVRIDPEPEWVEFMETLAGQAAIAIDNATLFDSLQRSNVELALAYDTTLEGWSSALELRDRETKGHTHRVTELTLQLAKEMGIKDEELVHVRRGALLHDIGKMGIPDSILFKSGPLNAAEWEIMRQHPVYAYNLLSSIHYLRPALDIPYCHHEKWDGTGYPRKLKGEQIPLAARIFAVADVWDALRSDRPYRRAWPQEQVLDYILSQSGIHFDPQVVEAFFRLLHSDLCGQQNHIHENRQAVIPIKP